MLQSFGIFCCAALSLTVLSCNEKHPTPPVSIEQMSAITLDLHTAEYFSQYIKTATGTHALDKNMDSLAVYYTGILKHYGMSLEDYQQAMDWYTNHPELLDSLYAHIITKASELKASHPEKTGSSLQQETKDTSSTGTAAEGTDIKDPA